MEYPLTLLLLQAVHTFWWRCSTGLWSQWPVWEAPLCSGPHLVCGLADSASLQTRCTRFLCRLASENNMTDEGGSFRDEFWLLFQRKKWFKKNDLKSCVIMIIWLNSVALCTKCSFQQSTTLTDDTVFVLHAARNSCANWFYWTNNTPGAFRIPVHSHETVSASISGLWLNASWDEHGILLIYKRQSYRIIFLLYSFKIYRLNLGSA